MVRAARFGCAALAVRAGKCLRTCLQVRPVSGECHSSRLSQIRCKRRQALRLRAPLDTRPCASLTTCGGMCRCPWVFGDRAAGWRQVLDAAAPSQHLRASAAAAPDASVPATGGAQNGYDSGPRHIYRHGRGRKRRSIVGTAHSLLGRMSAKRPPAASAQSVDHD